ncbi:MAG: UpxY family transcription antiterminator [Bacteroidota bacterium]
MNIQNTEPWHVLRVRPLFERVVESRLGKMGITALVPVQKQFRRSSDRTPKKEKILFSGYVFVHTEPARRNEVFQAGSQVISYLTIEGKPALLREQEISLIKTLSGLDGPISIISLQLSPGNQVEIISGPLRGFCGVVVNLPGKQRVTVYITGLQCIAQVELSVNNVRRL